MKLVWSPETASKAFIDTVKTCELFNESSVAELISAMAAGWNAKLIVETWSKGGVLKTSIGLAIASRHSGGRHVCIVPDEASRVEYTQGMEKATAGISPEVLVGDPNRLMGSLEGVDFMVVDCRLDDFAIIFKAAKLGERGAVLICKNANRRASSAGFRWQSVLGAEKRIVRSVFLPVGNGLDIVHVGAGNSGPKKGNSRWIRRVDRETGEEIVIRI